MNIANRLELWCTHKIKHSWTITILITLGCILFIPTLHYSFVFDDYPTILEHHHTYSMPFFSLFFSSSRWISRVFHRLGFMIGGMDPFGFRIINLALHICIGILFYILLATILEKLHQTWFQKEARLISFFSALLFIVHPAQTQTATYITQMSTEGAAALVVILATTLFATGATSTTLIRKFSCYMGMLITIFVGAGSKEIVVVLPCLITLLDFIIIAQGNLKSFLKRTPLHSLIFCTMFIGLTYVGMNVTKVAREAPQITVPSNRGAAATDVPKDIIQPSQYRWTQPKILLHYFSIFFWPRNLCFEYDFKIIKTPFSAEVFIPLFIWIIIIGAAFILLWQKKHLPIVLGIFWFLVAMLPRAIVPSQELVCDYKTYLASFGMILIASSILLKMIELCIKKIPQKNKLLAKLIATLTIIILIMGIAHFRNCTWKDEQTFWNDVVTKFPKRARAHNNLAIAYLENNIADKAIQHFHLATEIDSTYGEPHVNLALVYERFGNFSKAAHHYNAALKSGEMHPLLFYNLGVFNRNQGNLDLAEQSLRQAIALRSFYPQARYTLAQVLYSKKKFSDVITLCQETFNRQEMGNYPFNKLYGLALFEMGNTEKAFALLQLCNHEDPDIAFALGCCLFEKKHFSEAVKHLANAYAHNRHDIAVAYNYGQSLLAIKDYEKALESFGRCNNVINELPFVPLFKAQCLLGLGLRDEAKLSLLNIIKTSKNKAITTEAENYLKKI